MTKKTMVLHPLASPTDPSWSVIIALLILLTFVLFVIALILKEP
jgi:hypothetical protein